jgi:ABC-type multidrug transport system ATPase subunit
MPSVLFLDEPTSGLDSATSLRLVQLLSSIARSPSHSADGARDRSLLRTVATTIHQPRADIFELFDRLILLANGRVVYQGPAKDACRSVASGLSFES